MEKIVLTNKARKAMYWFVVIGWVNLVGVSMWVMLQRVQESNSTNFQFGVGMTLITGLFCIWPTPAIAARIMRWIEGDSAVKQPKSDPENK